ncbi:DNA-binding response regulator [Lacrimispora amygdalina]|uniref:Stage 0 sporulation protein A homolog n=1 Tax=Lacrimispora amygdalina TaxID=253257 RepID=A0A3E2N907_9FIRM|nr:response regulator transcription factor [Clostridium indicum]RFZ77476.1 DNA-binding response regulator [Clostridium indicum]
MSKSTILIVEDDAVILKTNRKALEIEGYRVLEAADLTAGRVQMEREIPDLIVLDILLPDGNGLRYCEELRSKSGVPILFLSALNTKADLITGLQAGGDDYIPKPYDMDVFLARVEALLRRSRLTGQGEEILCIGSLKLDTLSLRAFLKERDLLLKPREFALLATLAKNKGAFISTEALYKTVWGMEPASDTRTVKEHISRLRRKLGGLSPVRIESERGKGYCLKQLK